MAWLPSSLDGASIYGRKYLKVVIYISFCIILNNPVVRKGDSCPSGLVLIPGLGGWDLVDLGYTHIYIY